MKHITEFQLAAEAFPGAPYNDVHKRAKRDSIYDNRIKTCIHACYRPNWFPGYAVGAPSSTLLGAQEVAVPPGPANPDHVRGMTPYQECFTNKNAFGTRPKDLIFENDLTSIINMRL